MKPKKAIKEYEKSLKQDPDNVEIRVKLAGALRDAGREQDAAHQYVGIARSYRDRGEIAQAVEMCRSALGIVLGNEDAEHMLQALDAAGGEGADPGTLDAQGLPISPNFPTALYKFASNMKLRKFSSGDIVIREGETGSAVYLIVSGRVRILKASSDSDASIDSLEVAQLGEGEIFGEFAVFADLRRHATVQVVDECHAYEIEKEYLEELFKTYPEVAEHLSHFYQERLRATLLSTAVFFSKIPMEARPSILARCQTRRFEKGETLISEGRVVPGLFIVLLGNVEIVKGTGSITASILTLGEGAHVGAAPLLRGQRATISVVAQGACEVAVLSAKDFYEIVAQHPVVWDQVREEASSRAAVYE